MKIKTLVSALLILIAASPLFSEDIDKEHILQCMEFPEPDLRIGGTLNDPFFALNIHSEGIKKDEFKIAISGMEKQLSDKSDPELFYKLGNHYRDVLNFESSIKYYKKYLNTEPEAYNTDSGKTLLVKGDIYYSLAEIDVKKERTGNLEKSLLFLSRAIEMSPENGSIWIKLGDCYLSLGKTTEALYCYGKVKEKNSKNFEIYPRLQAASFQIDYLKLSENGAAERIINQNITSDFNFDYIETAINNSSDGLRDLLKMQHHIYLMRLLLIKKESIIQNNKKNGPALNKYFTKDEETVLAETEKFLKAANNKKMKVSHIKYLSGIVNYLKSDYVKAVSDFREVLNEGESSGLVHDEILFISIYFLKDEAETKKIALGMIKKNPDPEYYLILAGMEFRNKNMEKAEMLCRQSLKVDRNYPEAYSGIALISALKGSYTAADEMIKKGNFLVRGSNSGNTMLRSQMMVNEAAIALLKKEKERAYILLRSVISVDNNDKASQLYNRYFNKK